MTFSQFRLGHFPLCSANSNVQCIATISAYPSIVVFALAFVQMPMNVNTTVAHSGHFGTLLNNCGFAFLSNLPGIRRVYIPIFRRLSPQKSPTRAEVSCS